MRQNYASHRASRRERLRQARLANPEHFKALQRASYARHRERRCAESRAKVGFNTRMSWLRRLRRMGITEAEYNRRFEQQGGLCLICEKPGEGRFKRLCADHNHKTGKFRGLICNQCNSGLGHFKDNSYFLRAAIAYLEAT